MRLTPLTLLTLLLFCFRRTGYVSEVGADAEVYKRHAGKQQLDADDIRVAIKLKDTQIMRPPDRDVRSPRPPLSLCLLARLPTQRPPGLMSVQDACVLPLIATAVGVSAGADRPRR